MTHHRSNPIITGVALRLKLRHLLLLLLLQAMDAVALRIRMDHRSDPRSCTFIRCHQDMAAWEDMA